MIVAMLTLTLAAVKTTEQELFVHQLQQHNHYQQQRRELQQRPGLTIPWIQIVSPFQILPH